MTTTDVSNAVNAVINAYPSGSRIGFSGVEVGQCPAPVCEYMVRLGAPIPPMYGGLADGWGKVFPPELAPYFIHEGFEAGKQYPEGTIYMWDSPHIAFSIAPSDGSNTVKVFEQNADPDGAGCQVFNRTINTSSHTCTYVLIPILTTVPTPPITYELTTSRVLLTTKNPTTWYNLTDNSVANMLPVNTPFPAYGLATKPDGSKYFMTQADFGNAAVTGVPTNNNGVSMSDVKESPPAPYVPPAAPVAVQKPQTYQLLTIAMWFGSSVDAEFKQNAQGTLAKGSYYRFQTTSLSVQLGTDNMHALYWINIKDNVAPPPAPPTPTAVAEQVAAPSETAPDEWKSTFVAFNTNRQPVKYVMEVDYTFIDLSGYSKNTPTLHRDDEVDLSGTFLKDSTSYYRVYVADKTDPALLDINRWFGIPVINKVTGTPDVILYDTVYDTSTTTSERIALKRPTPYDRVIQLGTAVDKLYEKTVKTIDGVFHLKKGK